jgi:SdpI/YfhL protein family
MEAIGPVLILLSVPLMLRWVPRNRFYGLRIPSTLRNESVWYDVNALCARHLLLLGLFLVFLEFILPRSIRIETLRVIASVGFAAIMIADWRTANRWERQRRAPSPTAPLLRGR